MPAIFRKNNIKIVYSTLAYINYVLLYMIQYYVLFSYIFFCLESLGSSTVTFSEARRSFKTEVCGMYVSMQGLLRLHLFKGSIKAFLSNKA